MICLKNLFISKQKYYVSLILSIPVGNFNIVSKKKLITFTSVKFGISQFVSDGSNENFLI